MSLSMDDSICARIAGVFRPKLERHSLISSRFNNSIFCCEDDDAVDAVFSMLLLFDDGWTMESRNVRHAGFVGGGRCWGEAAKVRIDDDGE